METKGSLTEREIECLQWVASGLTSREIATLLGIAERTVNQHLSNGVEKLEAKNRCHAVAVAMGRRLLKMDTTSPIPPSPRERHRKI